MTLNLCTENSMISSRGPFNLSIRETKISRLLHNKQVKWGGIILQHVFYGIMVKSFVCTKNYFKVGLLEWTSLIFDHRAGATKKICQMFFD